MSLTRLSSYLVRCKSKIAAFITRNLQDKLDEAISIRDFGATGGPDDTAAIQLAFNWLAGGNSRTLLIPDGSFNVTNLTLTLQGVNSKNCKIISHGNLRHIGTGAMLTIKGGMYCKFDMCVVGDGYDSATIPDYTQPDPSGAKQAFVVESCRACKFQIVGHGYPGRVFRTRKENTAGVKLSFLDLDITTGNDTCGQAMYLEGTDAWGCITFAQTNWDYYGSVIDTVVDVSCVYWEAGCKNKSKPVIHLKGVSNSHFTTVAAGGAKMLVEGGSGITIQKALLGESDDWALEVVGSGVGQPKHQLTIHSLLTANTGATYGGIHLVNAVGVTLNDALTDGAYKGVSFSGLCRDIIIRGHFRNSGLYAVYGETASDLDNILVTGKCYSAGASGFCYFEESNTANVMLRDATVVVKGMYLRLRDNNNGVSVSGGSWSGSDASITTAINYRPRSISNVTGISTRKTAASAAFASGSVSGTKLIVTHGLWRSPNEVTFRIMDPDDNVVNTANTVIVSSITDTQIAFKFSGTTTLANPLNLVYTAKAEDRSN